MKPFYIDPVLLSLGPLQVRWYGLMYVVGFIVGSQLLKKLGKEGIFSPGPDKVDSLVSHVLIGMFFGARLAYVFIYNWDYYSEHLSELLAVWQGGLSFHGAIAGMALGALIFARKNGIPFLQASDCCVAAGAQGIFFGRMGNFINGELFGRVTDSSFGIVFKNGGPFARHPSQLYEAFGEGILLFVILWGLRKKFNHYGVLTAIFLGGYAIARYIIEFFREADSQLGYYFGDTTTMGQILCFVQLLFAISVYIYASKKKDSLKMNLA
jgi:phosphatidylglycerol---prolipoprotein diacylglyceryl transferase